jgi:hypothetical protein
MECARDLHERSFMDLAIWLPVLFVLGLAGFGLLFAFVGGCARV